VSYDRVPAHNPRGPFWQGYRWEPWVRIEAAGREQERGIYRVHSRRRGLDYIGISDNLASRIGTLRRCFAGGQGSHPACRCVHEAPGVVRISWVELKPDDVSRRELYGIEVELIAAYRAAMHESPHCQWSERLRRQGGVL
jgi:hypothetical protein